MHTAQLPAACENCATPLAGVYCHACGQHASSPLRHVGHAIEDFFESFWHLDGRVFRTLRGLLVPGRVACDYLAGRRARYIPPLRLFVILTVITFFIGQLTVGGSDEGRTVRTGAGAKAAATAVREARTEAEVRQALDRELVSLAEARKRVQAVPGAARALRTAEQELRTQADARIAVLRAQGAAAPAPQTDVGSDTDTSPAGASTAALAVAASEEPDVDEGMPGLVKELFGDRLRDPAAPWHKHDNPIDVAWLPAFGDRWFNRRVANAEQNLDLVERNGVRYLLSLALAAVPSALFVLVPLFALLLKLFHLRSGRGYLEHLVIALYSHAYLLLVLLASFVLAALEPAGAARGAIGTLFAFGQFIAWSSVPAYLLVMQRRVYGQAWWLTITKFVLLGFAYQLLVLAAVVYTVFAGLTSGL